MNLPSQSQKPQRYSLCAVTTLRSDALTELGRVVAHFGLLTERAREFVNFVAAEVDSLPLSVGSQEAIKLLPTALSVVRPVFSQHNIDVLTKAADQVAMVCEAVDHFSCSVWGTLASQPGELYRNEYRRREVGCCSDSVIYHIEEIHELAMEVSLTIRYLAEVQNIVREKIAEEPFILQKKQPRKRKSSKTSSVA